MSLRRGSSPGGAPRSYVWKAIGESSECQPQSVRPVWLGFARTIDLYATIIYKHRRQDARRAVLERQWIGGNHLLLRELVLLGRASARTQNRRRACEACCDVHGRMQSTLPSHAASMPDTVLVVLLNREQLRMRRHEIQ